MAPEQLLRLPRHVAVIMDGNGRWATARGMTRVQGHRRGKESVREVVETARELGIEFLTLFAFSSENWARPRREVDALMRLLRRYLKTELRRMMDNGIRLVAIGNTRKLPREVLSELRRVERATQRNDGMTVVLALSYGGRQDIVSAARALAREARDGSLRPEQITEQVFGRALMTEGIPDPDLLIRTSGEMRISNFLLWQLAYTEIYVTDTPWPEFRRKEFIRALRYFQSRTRKFGKTTEQLAVES